MRICVTVKQVPGTTKVNIDPVTGTLIRSGIEAKLNPYDLYSIETALVIRNMAGGSVTALTMGPPQAKEVLEEAFMMGADKMVLLTDKGFAGSDVLATSYTLSQGILGEGGFDIIVCGKQTTDGDTAQVGPELAEFLGIPHVSNVSAILDVNPGFLTVEVDLANSVEVQKIALPCLICVDKGIFTPRLPSYKRKRMLEAQSMTIRTLTDCADKQQAHYGLDGSPTQVEKVFFPEARGARRICSGKAEEVASEIIAFLEEEKLI